MDKANSRRSANSNFEEVALRFLDVETGGVASVWQLYGALLLADHSTTMKEATDVVWRLADQGKVELEYLPSRSFVEFLGHWERNLGTYTSFAASLVAVLAAYALPTNAPFLILRWIFGSALVLFIPGYVATGALFPKYSDLNSLERFALSIGLSLALVLIVAIILNYTPVGIRVLPVVTSLTIVTMLLGTITLIREYFAD